MPIVRFYLHMLRCLTVVYFSHPLGCMFGAPVAVDNPSASAALPNPRGFLPTSPHTRLRHLIYPRSFVRIQFYMAMSQQFLFSRWYSDVNCSLGFLFAISAILANFVSICSPTPVCSKCFLTKIDNL